MAQTQNRVTVEQAMEQMREHLARRFLSRRALITFCREHKSLLPEHWQEKMRRLFRLRRVGCRTLKTG